MAEIKSQQPAGICMRPTVITLIGPPQGPGARPREITLLTSASYSQAGPSVDPLQSRAHPHAHSPDSSVLVSSKRIPRPPNAFMIFANEWRKRLAVQHPTESNKSISVRLGQLWKNMNKHSKEIYYQRSRQAGQDHKQKYPGYVYNPKEARLRKALRLQSRGFRYAGGAPARWTKSLIMNHNRQSLLSPVVLPHQQICADRNKMLHEQVDRDSGMLQSYPNYLDLPYDIPSSDYQPDNPTWYPYIQSGVDSNGIGSYMDRVAENKLPVDWSTPYNSEQGNFIRASPQSSPYSMQSHQEVLPSSLLLNGDGVHREQTTPDHKPAVDQLLCQNNKPKDPEQQVKELLASAQVISEDSASQEESSTNGNGTRLPGFHQAFGSTEIGRFSQPDGFFEAAVAAENERKVCMSPLPPPTPAKRGRAPRGRRAKTRAEHEPIRRETWQDSWPGPPNCEGPAHPPLNNMQRMNCGYTTYHSEHTEMYQHQHQWHPETPYQYYPSYYDCYPPAPPPPPPSWRPHPHPYYHPTHYPHPHSHPHQHQHPHYQQYGEYRSHYGRWAVGKYPHPV